MPQSFTIVSPRYYIRDVNGNHFDIFNKRANAIKSAITFATNYPSTTFIVVKKVMNKEKIIFSFRIESQCQIDDLKEAYQSIIDIYQKKLDKTKTWRKFDGD